MRNNMEKFRLLTWTFIFRVFIYPVFPLPAKHDSVDFQILHSNAHHSICSNTTYKQCETNSEREQLYITWCNLSCATNLKLHCINDEAYGMVYICRDEKQCPPGHYRSLIVEGRNDLVVSQYSECPLGHYRPETADCYIPCRQHSVTPDNVIVFHDGNATSNKIVYCDYTRGYFSHDKSMTINMDSYYASYCDHVMSQKSLCPNNQMPLPNGTCVHPCESGHYRDDHDLFNCKPNISVSPVSKLQNEKEYTSVVSTEYHNVTTGTSSTVTSMQDIVPDVYKWTLFLVIVWIALSIVVIIGVVVIVVLIWWFCPKRQEGSSLGSIEEKVPLSQAQSDGSSKGSNEEERKVYKITKYNCNNLTIVEKANTVTCQQFPEQADSVFTQSGAEESLVDGHQTHVKVLADNTR